METNENIETRRVKLAALERIRAIIKNKYSELSSSGNPNFINLKNTFSEKFQDNFDRWYGNIGFGISLIMQIDTSNKTHRQINLEKINWLLENLGFENGVSNILLADDFETLMK